MLATTDDCPLEPDSDHPHFKLPLGADLWIEAVAWPIQSQQTLTHFGHAHSDWRPWAVIWGEGRLNPRAVLQKFGQMMPRSLFCAHWRLPVAEGGVGAVALFDGRIHCTRGEAVDDWRVMLEVEPAGSEPIAPPLDAYLLTFDPHGLFARAEPPTARELIAGVSAGVGEFAVLFKTSPEPVR